MKIISTCFFYLCKFITLLLETSMGKYRKQKHKQKVTVMHSKSLQYFKQRKCMHPMRSTLSSSHMQESKHTFS